MNFRFHQTSTYCQRSSSSGAVYHYCDDGARPTAYHNDDGDDGAPLLTACGDDGGAHLVVCDGGDDYECEARLVLLKVCFALPASLAPPSAAGSPTCPRSSRSSP